jgi:hypothetical protein
MSSDMLAGPITAISLYVISCLKAAVAAFIGFSLAYIILALIGLTVNKIKQLEGMHIMPKWLTDLMGIIAMLAGLCIAMEQPGNGAQKKADVIAAVDAKLDEPGGLDRPAWLPKVTFDWILGIIIDAIVARLNSAGAFAKSSAS